MTRADKLVLLQAREHVSQAMYEISCVCDSVLTDEEHAQLIQANSCVQAAIVSISTALGKQPLEATESEKSNKA